MAYVEALLYPAAHGLGRFGGEDRAARGHRHLLVAGTGLVTPKKKPKGGELTLSDKEYTSQISSFRAPIERLVAHFKNWKIFYTDYRRPYSTDSDAFDAARALFFFSII